MRPLSSLRRMVPAAWVPRRTIRLRLTALYGALFLVSAAGVLVIINILARSWPWPPFQTGQAKPSGPLRTAGVAAAFRAQLQVNAHLRAAALNHLVAESAITLGVMAVASVALGWLVAGRVLRPVRQMTAAARAISEDNLHQRLAVRGPGDELKDLGDTIDGLLDRLQAAFDAQRQFVAHASHELRTPLTLAHTLLQMAVTEPHPTLASYQATCQNALRATQHQEQLIEALLTLARSQRGLDHRERADLATVTQQALDAREPDAAAAGLTVSASISIAPTLADDRLLQRLAVNLIDNAIRHNVPGGRIDIEVTAPGGCARLLITNTGPVVPAGQAARLLEPFQRLPADRPAGGQGLGLGLPIVAAIAKAHHATLAISPRPGGGLSIEVTFPPATRRTAARHTALATT